MQEMNTAVDCFDGCAEETVPDRLMALETS